MKFFTRQLPNWFGEFGNCRVKKKSKISFQKIFKFTPIFLYNKHLSTTKNTPNFTINNLKLGVSVLFKPCFGFKGTTFLYKLYQY